MTTIQTHQTRNNHNYETHLKAVKITLAFLSSSAAPEGRLMLSMRIKEMPRNNRIPGFPIVLYFSMNEIEKLINGIL